MNTTDSGLNWENQTDNINPYLFSIYFANSNTGWAVGNGGTILKTTNGVTFTNGQQNKVPEKFKLFQNYPNPFNPSTAITFQLTKRSFVTIRVYYILGHEVDSLVNEEKPGSSYTVRFDGSKLSSGIYFYQLRTNESVQTRKMTLLK